jgi:hypothetical protein
MGRAVWVGLGDTGDPECGMPALAVRRDLAGVVYQAGFWATVMTRAPIQ